ncbi:MAG: disulfide reductase [Desulfobacteraceae bacterium]|nr:CoB--CoM heterodisulfide reductase iron-sulfur subunit B family protein [Desulfobacteraceae bacterium]MBC2754181.1 disulfide reductase [Desulfobacteraceae bacterium]
MKYFYYPGCSLEGTAKEYHISTTSLMKALGAELIEIESWSCCGASAAESVSDLLSYVLPARNLAIAEKMSAETSETLDILVPCSACYLNLKKVTEDIKTNLQLLDTINTVLKEDNLELKNKLQVRHLLDILVNDMDINFFKTEVKHFFEDFSVAPYYGCQCLRPYHVFDNPEKPKSMEPLILATGATIHTWEMGPKCCGASHMSTKPEVGQTLVGNILKSARGADMIITVCPMCQMNLEAFQKKISQACNESFNMTILYLPQFMGMAMGLSEKDIRLDLNLSITKKFKTKYLTMTSKPVMLMTASA